MEHFAIGFEDGIANKVKNDTIESDPEGGLHIPPL